jgi:hypothetical protein
LTHWLCFLALHTSKSFAQVFTFNIRRLVHDIYTRASLLNQDPTQIDTTLHPVLKASMSSSSFDAVVPEILTFRPDKDDPLDMAGDQHVVEDTRKKVEVKEKRMELITAVVSTITSWNISEAFEEICCRSLKLSKGTKQNISYGLKR